MNIKYKLDKLSKGYTKYFKDIYTTKSEYPYTIYIYIGKCFRKIKKTTT